MPQSAGQPNAERERRVRQEAYRIWEQAGRPEGRAEAHWAEAMKRIDREDANASSQPGVPTEAQFASAKEDKKKAGASKPGGRKGKPVSPGG